MGSYLSFFSTTDNETMETDNKIIEPYGFQKGEPIDWNQRGCKLWLRVEFGFISPFKYEDSLIRVFCCYDEELGPGDIYQLMRRRALIKEYNTDELVEVIPFDPNGIDSYDKFFDLIHSNLSKLIIDAYGPNGWFTSYHKTKGYQISLVSNEDPNKPNGVEYVCHFKGSISMTVCFVCQPM